MQLLTPKAAATAETTLSKICRMNLMIYRVNSLGADYADFTETYKLINS